MNRARRSRIDAIVSKLEELSADLGMLRDEEQEALDNVPESLQAGEAGQRMEEAVDTIESAISGVDDAVDHLKGLL